MPLRTARRGVLTRLAATGTWRLTGILQPSRTDLMTRPPSPPPVFRMCSCSSNVEVDSIVFATGSPSYEITVGASLSLVLTGAGIVSSANPSNFIAASDSDGGHGTILFSGRAAAGTASFTNEANPVPGQESGMTSSPKCRAEGMPASSIAEALSPGARRAPRCFPRARAVPLPR